MPINAGQKVGILPSATAGLVGGRHTTGAHQHLQDATHTHQAGRKRRVGANRTSDSAAAPGAAGVHRQPPETEAPARPSPHTTDRTTPGKTTTTTTTLTCFVIIALTLSRVSRRERESPNRSDTDSRARRRSRSYSPIRKRRRDSPSFMEARRITR